MGDPKHPLVIYTLALITRPPDGVLLAPTAVDARCSVPAALRLVTPAITRRPDGVL